jgi:hypothetical protein
MARRAAAAKPSAEANQQAANYDCDVAARHLWCWHSVPDKRRSNRRCNEAANKCRTPRAICRLRIDKTGKNATDTGDSASEHHEQNGGKADQCATDRRGNWSEIVHDLTRIYYRCRRFQPNARLLVYAF